jgi:hypothetical protein
MSRKARTPPANQPKITAPSTAWRLPDGGPPAPPGRLAQWLLAAAILVQLAWIAALAAMALFVR